MKPIDYQEHWESIDEYIEEDFVLKDQSRLLEVLEANFIFCIASGLVEEEEGSGGHKRQGSNGGRRVMKYYTYAMATTRQVVCLMEIVVDVDSGAAHITLKTNSSTEGRNCVDYFFTAVSSLISHALPLDDYDDGF